MQGLLKTLPYGVSAECNRADDTGLADALTYEIGFAIIVDNLRRPTRSNGRSDNGLSIDK